MGFYGSEPARVERVGEDALKVQWDDGHDSIYPWELLRRSCPCAVCSAEARGDASTSDSHREGAAGPGASKRARPVEVKPVGRYAMTIRWDDGHSTGIFSYDYLRSLCPCEACRPNQMTEG